MNNKIEIDATLFRKIGQEGRTENFENGKLNEWAIFVYVALRRMYRDGTDNQIALTVKQIYSCVLCEQKAPKSSISKDIKDGIEQLKEYYGLNVEKQGTIYIFNGSDIDARNIKNFFYIECDFIQQIVKEKGGVKLLAYYLYLASTINYNRKVGFTGRETIAEKLNITVKTVTSRNQKLDEIGALIFKQRRTKDANGEWVMLSNMYSLPEDTDKLEKETQDSLEKEVVKVNKEIAKERKEKVVGFKRKAEPKEIDYSYDSWNGTDNPF